MDDLNCDIVTNILSFLPEGDFFRFKELNSGFYRIIEKRKEMMQLPKIEISIKDEDHKELCLVFVNCKNRREMKFSVNYSNPRAIKIYTENEFSGFFGHLFKENFGIISLQKMFEFIMGKGDIQELSVYKLADPECLFILTEAVENNHNPIRSISIGPKYDAFPRICDLLKAVATQKRQVRPTLRMRHYITQLEKHWDRVLVINNLAAMFSNSWFEFNASAPGYIIALIAKKWKEFPFTQFNFHLRLRGGNKPLREPDIVEIRGVDDLIITKTMGHYLLCISPDQVNASIRLEDANSGNILEFHKRQGYYRPFCEGIEDIIDIEITASIVK